MKQLPLVVAFAAAAVASAAAQGDAALKTLLARAGAYVETFEDVFSNVVSEERYEQDTYPRGTTYTGGPRQRHRQLVSDFLLVHFPDPEGWVPFRDVFRVDGQPVRDRQDRLVQLFLQSGTDTAERAKEITEEGARYNIGVVRTVNHPLLAFHVLRTWQQPRFRFSNLKADASAGPGAFVVAFSEQTRPSVIRGIFNRDMPMHGRLWLDGENGRVLKTEILVDDARLSASIVTRFAYDATFGTTVPVEMREDYRHPNGDRASGVATYGRFRRFGVEVNDTLSAGAGR